MRFNLAGRALTPAGDPTETDAVAAPKRRLPRSQIAFNMGARVHQVLQGGGNSDEEAGSPTTQEQLEQHAATRWQGHSKRAA